MKQLFISFILSLPASIYVHSQNLLANVEARRYTRLDGKWQVIVDPYDAGNNDRKPIWKDQVPVGKAEFFEYKFDSTNTLNVPGDWNSQNRELKYYEGTIWYKKNFTYQKKNSKKIFLYFSGVSYECDVYVNGDKAGAHEGSFTPFQFDISDKVKEGSNSVIVRVNNTRRPDNIPAMNFDWWNYGGITRDVYVVETPSVFIRDYFIQLAKNSKTDIRGWVELNEPAVKKIVVQIPELKIN